MANLYVVVFKSSVGGGLVSRSGHVKAYRNLGSALSFCDTRPNMYEVLKVNLDNAPRLTIVETQ